ALGSPTHPVAANIWDAWCAPYPQCWRGSGDTRRLAFAPMFGHQYSQMWIDFRGIRDAAMRAAGLDYFENSRRETWA
ncbi:glucoamylase family protein, partial [Salmonella enterica]